MRDETTGRADRGFCPSCCKPCARKACEACGYEVERPAGIPSLAEILTMRGAPDWSDVDLPRFARAVAAHVRKEARRG